MAEACKAVPFSHSILSPNLEVGGRGEGFEGGRDGLDAAVEGGGVETLDWGREC